MASRTVAKKVNPKDLNTARLQGHLNLAANMPPDDMVSDLNDAFAFYDKDNNGWITIPHFQNILRNFGFHDKPPKDQLAELQKADNEW